MRIVRWLALANAFLWFGLAAAKAETPAKLADPLAEYVKASAWVETNKGPLYLEFVSDGEAAGFRARSNSSATPKLYRLSSPREVLMLLADKRMSAFWQQLRGWAGPSLDAMRERIVSQRRAAFEKQSAEFATVSTGQSIARAPVKALLQLGDILIETGKPEEAEKLLREHLTKMPFSLKASYRGIEWQLVASEIARARRARLDFDGVNAQYEYIERVMANSPYILNVRVNRAAFLAEVGRYQESLTVIEKAWSDFNNGLGDDDVPGSDRQFTWIKACALNGLGKKEEAAAIMGTIEPDKQPTDPDFMIEPNNSLRLRSAVCMKDVPAIKTMLLAELNSGAIGPILLNWMQPGMISYGTSQAVIDAIRADPELQAAVQARMEVLPAELMPALNGWRASPMPRLGAAQ